MSTSKPIFVQIQLPTDQKVRVPGVASFNKSGSSELIIRDDFVSWGGLTIPADSIISLSWGYFYHYDRDNVLHTHFEFHVGMGFGPRNIVKIRSYLLSDGNQGGRVRKIRSGDFKLISEKLWKIAGKRILDQMIEHLRKGGSVKVGDAKLVEKGVEITVRGLFSAKTVLIPWTKVGINR
ncbi:MAG: hypothetical protein AAF570_20290, partial [Bacteroidota bacterium]